MLYTNIAISRMVPRLSMYIYLGPERGGGQRDPPRKSTSRSTPLTRSSVCSKSIRNGHSPVALDRGPLWTPTRSSRSAPDVCWIRLDQPRLSSPQLLGLVGNNAYKLNTCKTHTRQIQTTWADLRVAFLGGGSFSCFLPCFFSLNSLLSDPATTRPSPSKYQCDRSFSEASCTM
ncbi:hypothetical protein BD289DRAFT_128067 [Coniella lustricola]|uniref:Uncharacterized protein n=1 Tax=Coniella lustricola TaxID=2025994 RepID=A0A2T2ZW62_9PEZI|nr:hypothetical protein BD289DRAFT_128067 [Coniella lustricola]